MPGFSFFGAILSFLFQLGSLEAYSNIGPIGANIGPIGANIGPIG